MAARNCSRLALILFLALALAYAAGSQSVGPNGAQILYNQTETRTPDPAQFINTSGGTFTTLQLYAETQDPRWKAYAGNVTGTLTLDDASNYTIYNWQLSVVTGEVYTTRNSSVDWASIGCSPLSMIYQEEAILNHTTSYSDSINSTFRFRKHSSFYVGDRFIQNSTCPSTATWVNNTAQTVTENALFQEILLSDGKSLIYSTLILNKASGFNFKNYDFQMIVAEVNTPGPSATPYYFWLELV